MMIKYNSKEWKDKEREHTRKRISRRNNKISDKSIIFESNQLARIYAKTSYRS